MTTNENIITQESGEHLEWSYEAEMRSLTHSGTFWIYDEKMRLFERVDDWYGNLCTVDDVVSRAKTRIGEWKRRLGTPL